MALLTRKVVKAVIRAEDTGHYFIIRSTIPIMRGWSLVGGGMELGERALDAIFREIQEELNVSPNTFKTVVERPGHLTSHHRFLGIPVTMHTRVFDATVARESNLHPRPNWEVWDSKWVTESELPILLGSHYFKLTQHS